MAYHAYNESESSPPCFYNRFCEIKSIDQVLPLFTRAVRAMVDHDGHFTDSEPFFAGLNEHLGGLKLVFRKPDVLQALDIEGFITA